MALRSIEQRTELTTDQARFVGLMREHAHPWLILRGDVGTGKTFALVQGLVELLKSDEVTLRILLSAPGRSYSEAIGSRIRSDVPSSRQVVALTKEKFRSMVSRNRIGERISSGVYLAPSEVLAQPEVSKALSETFWDLIVIEDEVSFEIGEPENENASVRLGADITFRSRSCVILSTRADEIALNEKAHVVTLNSGFSNQTSDAHRRRLDYIRSGAEVSFLEDVRNLLRNTVLSDSTKAELAWSAASSIPALSQSMLKVRNLLAHGHTMEAAQDELETSWGYSGAIGAAAGAAVLGPLGVALGAGVAAGALAYRRSQETKEETKEAEKARLAKRLLGLVDKAENLSADSKLQRLIDAVEDGEVETPLVVFADHSATHSYLKVMLEDLGLPLHEVSQKEGFADANLASVNDFNERGGILIAKTAPLRGMELQVTSALHYDLPLEQTVMLVRTSRIRGAARALQTPSTEWVLVDMKHSLVSEKSLAEMYGFELQK